MERYLGGFSHMGCGGKPYAYVNQSVECRECGYSVKPPPNEALGETLAMSEFERIK